MQYNLEVLNDKEFELLSKDLLEKVLQTSLQNFKSGKDGGIDVRYSSNSSFNEIVIQAKAYTKSAYSDLKRVMRKEKENMDSLSPSPNRYILTTTFSLSPKQIDEIVSMMNPYIVSPQDVYGRERIESLISNEHEIEKKYYKLWLTSTNVLETILHNGQRAQSEFYESLILKKASLYVPTKNLHDAIDKLNENKFIIISGEPGVGKTTIAYILICDLLGKGYELINIDDKISDALNLLSSNPDTKQVFFFDDFLGANINEILNPKNTENKILNFIRHIESSKNKFLILTSRTTILNQANDNYEHFAREKFDKRSKYELKLNHYTKLDKAKIIYNHLYFNNIPEDFKNNFFINKNYLKIIEHKNYFPRLIEFITNHNNFDIEYYNTVDEFIFKNLDNPSEIWKMAFERQLEDEDRFLLLSIFSFAQKSISHSRLEKAFINRYNYEIKQNNITKKVNAFNRSLKKILDSFIISIKTADGENEYQLLNPSIADFLINYLKDNNDERNRILNSIIYIEQLTGYFDPLSKNKINLKNTFLESYYSTFLKLVNKLENRHHSFVILDILCCFDKFFRINLIKDSRPFDVYLQSLVESVPNSYVMSSKLITLIENIYKSYSKKTRDIVTLNWSTLMSLIIKNAYDSNDLAELANLHSLYSINLAEIIENENINPLLQNKINKLFEEYARDFQYIASDDDIIETYSNTGKDNTLTFLDEKLWDSYSVFFLDCGLSDYYDSFNHDYDIDTAHVLSEVIQHYEHNEDDYNIDAFIDQSPSISDEYKMIEELFER
ncbi:restriction endonuclease [Sphingobacterium anhuiense]|uniref:nSTAND3 domain-containing NTPase n=1 Tax=Sphingobacterium anhuiense TaxID=493780 RepID=UPI003C2C5839